MTKKREFTLEGKNITKNRTQTDIEKELEYLACDESQILSLESLTGFMQVVVTDQEKGIFFG